MRFKGRASIYAIAVAVAILARSWSTKPSRGCYFSWKAMIYMSWYSHGWGSCVYIAMAFLFEYTSIPRRHDKGCLFNLLIPGMRIDPAEIWQGLFQCVFVCECMSIPLRHNKGLFNMVMSLNACWARWDMIMACFSMFMSLRGQHDGPLRGPEK